MNQSFYPQNQPATAPQPPQPPARKDRAWIWAIIAVIGVVVAVFAFNYNGGGGTMPTSSATSSVLYEVEGTADSATFTMETPTGTAQATGKAVPMTNSRTGERGIKAAFPAGAFLYISAQNEGADGYITCRITVDGEVISENVASGGYAIATCQGTA